MFKDIAESGLRTTQNMIYCLRCEDIITDTTFNVLNQKLIYAQDFLRALPKGTYDLDYKLPKEKEID